MTGTTWVDVRLEPEDPDAWEIADGDDARAVPVPYLPKPARDG